MKTILFTISISLFCTILSAQNQVLKDSLTHQKNNSQSVVIRCGGSIQYGSSPLYIIDGIPFQRKDSLKLDGFEKDINIAPENIKSIEVLKGEGAVVLYGSRGKNGVIIITTKNHKTPIVNTKKYAFKTYQFNNDNWNISQDIFNAIESKVPGVSISLNSNLNNAPNIRMRGDDNTIVIVDGIRYDASILNTLNPSEIESITVAPSAAASNYLLNN